MLGEKNNQGNFFDDYVYHLIPQDHILMKINREIDFSFVKDETADLYCPDNGRPSWPPEVLFRVLFLEYYYNLSDVEVVKRCQYNLVYRHFLGLSLGTSTPDDTTLVVFRERLGEKRFERLFNRIVEQCQGKGLLEGKLKLVDATHIIADVAIPNTVNLLRQGRRMIIKKIIQAGSVKGQKLKEEYYTEGKIPHRASKEDLEAEVTQSQKFLDETKGKFDNEEIKELLEIFEKIIRGNLKEEKVYSFVDPDARFGYKTKEKPFLGYKAHIAEDTSEIVTSVELLPGNTIEGKKEHLESLLQKEEEKEIKSEAVVADGIYNSADNRELIKDKKMKAYIPSNKVEKNIEKFIYDAKNDKVICPDGKASQSKTRQERGCLHIFSTHDCKVCSKQVDCPKANEGRIRVFVSDDYLLKLGEDKEEKRWALSLRRGIERKFGEGKKWHRLERARYRRKWRVAIQTFMTFLVINVKRMVKLLEIKRIARPAYAYAASG